MIIYNCTRGGGVLEVKLSRLPYAMSISGFTFKMFDKTIK